jgi:hypothetical protein
VIICATSAVTAHAYVSGINVFPDVVLMGTEVHVNAVDDYSDPIADMKYEWSFFGGNPNCSTGPNVGAEDSQSFQWFFDCYFPGTYDFKVTTTFSNSEPQSSYTQRKTVDPADNVLPQPSTFGIPQLFTGDPIVVSFDIYAGPTQIDKTPPSAWAQEYLGSRVFMGFPQPDSDWFPPDGQNVDSFWLDDTTIRDVKDMALSPNIWQLIPTTGPLAVFDRYREYLRLSYTDFCNNLQRIPLGYVDLRRRKISATEYVVELQ